MNSSPVAVLRPTTSTLLSAPSKGKTENGEGKDVQVVYPVPMNPNVREPVYRILNGQERLHLVEYRFVSLEPARFFGFRATFERFTESVY